MKKAFFDKNSIKSRLIMGLGAQGFGKVILTIRRFVEVLLLLQMWESNYMANGLL